MLLAIVLGDMLSAWCCAVHVTSGYSLDSWCHFWISLTKYEHTCNDDDDDDDNDDDDDDGDNNMYCY